MTCEEIVRKSKEFQDESVRQMYTVIANFMEWQKELK